MGLTIHYTLSLPAKTTVPEVRQKLRTLRQACLDLPFQEVSEMLEFRGEECNPDRLERGHPHRWFLGQADSHICFQIASSGKPLAVQQLQDGCYSRTVLPTHVIGFSCYPGNGSEEANIGLSRFPKTVIVGNNRTGKDHRIKVADGDCWKWHSFCKTQFANEHGLEHFLQCHLSVVAMLDAAKRLGFDVTVNDESDYFEKRDVHGLVKAIGSWDQMIAAFGGSLKDAAGNAGMTIESPIFARKDFETLEMKGQSQLPPGWGDVVRGLVTTTTAVCPQKTGN
jgi:hypothetical protein